MTRDMLSHEDRRQIDDLEIEEMDINWQIAMIAIRMKKFYKKIGRRVHVDGKAPVGFDKKKLECFNCHNTGQFARECTSKGTHDGKNQMGLLIMDDVVRRIGMKAVKEKEQLKKTLDSWKDSSKNLWRLINSGMSSSSKIGLGSVILISGRPNVNSVRPNVNIVRTNINFVRQNVNSVRPKQSVPTSTSPNFSTERPQDPPLKNMVARGSKGYITGKRRIRVGNLDFDSVSFVKELGHFNLFSTSQICYKQHKVLFTETECLVVSSNFKMPDENQILLKVPRHHNMYSFDMKTPTPAKGFACLIVKATFDESKMRPQKESNTGPPARLKLERLIPEPLHTLHMDHLA
ncbi:ribonuclease H-like domain-containing protein [Tanacetum coccineum]